MRFELIIYSEKVEGVLLGCHCICNLSAEYDDAIAMHARIPKYVQIEYASLDKIKRPT